MNRPACFKQCLVWEDEMCASSTQRRLVFLQPLVGARSSLPLLAEDLCALDTLMGTEAGKEGFG